MLGSISLGGILFFSMISQGWFSLLIYAVFIVFFILLYYSEYYCLSVSLFSLTYILLVFSFLFSIKIRTNFDYVVVVIPILYYLTPLLFVSQIRHYKIEWFIICWIFSEIIFNKSSIGNSLLNLSNSLAGIYPAAQWISITGCFSASALILLISYFIFKTS